MRLLRLAVVLVPLFLAACGMTEQQKSDDATVYYSSVDRATYNKMARGDDLSLDDIKNLTRARIDDGIILRYLRDHKTVYYLTAEDISNLRTSGVSTGVINYMLQTPRTYTTYNPAIGNGFGYFPYYDPFWGPPYPNYPYPDHFAR